MTTDDGIVRQHSRPVYVLLSLVTAGFLLIQMAAAVVESNQLYPVTAYAMFSHPTGGLAVQFEVAATTVDDDVRRVPAEEFGLTELQLRSFIIGEIGPAAEHVRPDATDRLAAMASVWSERHERELSGLAVVRVERSIASGGPQRSVVGEWRR